MLVVISGLPGTGKTTIARQVARRALATYLRIDTIEQAMRCANVLADDVGPAGYMVGYALAESNLKLGQTVIAECVNPLIVTRMAWRRAATVTASRIIEVEIVCSDKAEHRRRVENRLSDIPGLVLPDWAAVLSREYEPWPEPHLVIDTAVVSAPEATGQIHAAMVRPPGDTPVMH